MTNETWRAAAACLGQDPEMFFPVTVAQSTAAKAICAVCPVRTPCREHAIAFPEKFGVWGGQDEGERVTVKRKRWRQERQAAASRAERSAAHPSHHGLRDSAGRFRKVAS